MSNIKIGISIGDMNGVGLEVVLKSFSDSRMLNMMTPVIYGSSKVVAYHKNIVNKELRFMTVDSVDKVKEGAINVINCWTENANIEIGKATEDGGKYAKISLEAATKDVLEGKLHALVTAPINKNAMKMAGFEYPGHTEYITETSGKEESLMFMVSDDIKVALVTNHLQLKEVAEKVTKKLILKKIRLLNESLVTDFGIERPIIAVLGLNPHAGDEGALGNEEQEIIRPAIIEAKKNGLLAVGPFAADSFFGSSAYKKYDAVLAMYHDQGLVAFKTLAFGGGVNFTAGLNIVRTSPDHGTAFDIAGKGVADPSSFRQALFIARAIAKNRVNYTERHQSAVEKHEQPIEDSNAVSEQFDK